MCDLNLKKILCRLGEALWDTSFKSPCLSFRVELILTVASLIARPHCSGAAIIGIHLFSFIMGGWT